MARNSEMMTDIELKELVASLAVAQAETNKQFQETGRRFQETDRRFQETDKQLRELAKQIGGLGNKFGSFTEGMAFPSMEKLLRTRFQMKVVTTYAKAKWGGKTLELDAMAYSDKAVYIVEVKSHLREEGLQQMLESLSQFREAFPEHADKALYGILAVVHVPEQLQAKVIREGIYLALIQDEQFTLQIPENFVARAF